MKFLQLVRTSLWFPRTPKGSLGIVSTMKLAPGPRGIGARPSVGADMGGIGARPLMGIGARPALGTGARPACGTGARPERDWRPAPYGDWRPAFARCVYVLCSVNYPRAPKVPFGPRGIY